MSAISLLSVGDPLHIAFLSILPKIERHGRVHFRHLKCPDKRRDCITEMVALAWKWLISLAQRGKDATQFPCTLAVLAARAVSCSRKVAGQINAGDVLNELAQQRHHFTVGSLPSSTTTSHEYLYGTVYGQRKLDEFEERLQCNAVTPPDEQAMFRIDFKDWLKTLTPRERRIIKAMARNERTKDLARQFEVSAARISQLRREFMEGWRRYWDEEPASGVA